MKKRSIGFLAAVMVVTLGATGPGFAQSGGGGSAVQFRVGGYFPVGGGEFWDETEEVFTVDISDFDEVMVGFSYVTSINNNFEIGFNIDFYDERVDSTYRGSIVNEFDLPSHIFHTSSLELVPVTVDFRLLPFGRYKIRGPQGRRVLKPVFYVGGGAGVLLWDYEEIGDFLDFTFDPAVLFFDRFKDDGAAFEVHALAGLEIPMSPRFNLLVEGRYSWADDDLDDGFAGLGNIELGGVSAFIGGSFRF